MDNTSTQSVRHLISTQQQLESSSQHRPPGGRRSPVSYTVHAAITLRARILKNILFRTYYAMTHLECGRLGRGFGRRRWCPAPGCYSPGQLCWCRARKRLWIDDDFSSDGWFIVQYWKCMVTAWWSRKRVPRPSVTLFGRKKKSCCQR